MNVTLALTSSGTKRPAQNSNALNRKLVDIFLNILSSPMQLVCKQFMNFCDTLLNIYMCIYVMNDAFRILRKALASCVERERQICVTIDPDFEVITTITQPSFEINKINYIFRRKLK